MRVRQWGLPGVAWWVSSATRPPDTEETLRARGGKQIDAVQILARELGGGLPDLGVPADVRVELVSDERTFRAASMVAVRGLGEERAHWRGARPRVRRGDPGPGDLVQLPRGGLVGRQPASSGGCTLRGEVAKLWGAVTLREYRRRGSYRAVLAERLRLAREHGATLALVKGRAETSGPILLRAGFADYGAGALLLAPIIVNQLAVGLCMAAAMLSCTHDRAEAGNRGAWTRWPRSSARCSGCPRRSSTTRTGSGPIPAA